MRRLMICGVSPKSASSLFAFEEARKLLKEGDKLVALHCREAPSTDYTEYTSKLINHVRAILFTPSSRILPDPIKITKQIKGLRVSGGDKPGLDFPKSQPHDDHLEDFVSNYEEMCSMYGPQVTFQLRDEGEGERPARGLVKAAIEMQASAIILGKRASSSAIERTLNSAILKKSILDEVVSTSPIDIIVIKSHPHESNDADPLSDWKNWNFAHDDSGAPKM